MTPRATDCPEILVAVTRSPLYAVLRDLAAERRAKKGKPIVSTPDHEILAVLVLCEPMSRQAVTTLKRGLLAYIDEWERGELWSTQVFVVKSPIEIISESAPQYPTAGPPE